MAKKRNSKTDLAKLEEEIQHRKDMQRLETLLLRGVTNYDQLAAAFNVTPKVIQGRIGIIQKQWEESDSRKSKEVRAKLIAQLLHIAQTAWDSFERSKQDEEEVSITKRRCPDCDGEGTEEYRPGEYRDCPTCFGDGHTLSETRKIRGQVGDMTCLKLAKECVTEIAKMRGCYPKTKNSSSLVLASRNAEGKLEAMVATIYDDAPPEHIIRALTVLDAIPKRKVIETTAVRKDEQ